MFLRLAYDGRGNYLVRHKENINEAVAQLGGFEAGLYAEECIDFAKELAVMVARSRDGSVMSYPVVETIHRDSILYVTEAPADVPSKIMKNAQQIAEATIASLDGAGIFG